MLLTAKQIQNIQPLDKNKKYPDGTGLYLLVTPSGSKYWRYNYRFRGKQATYPYGVYPEVSLKQARDLHAEIKRKIKDGIDPAHERRVSKILSNVSLNNSFEFVAREYVDSRKSVDKAGYSVWSKKHAEKVEGRLDNYVYPFIGKSAIVDITAPEILALLRAIESKGYRDTAHRVLSYVSKIFKYGIVTQRCTANPAADLVGALLPVKSESFVTITDPVEIGGLLRAIDGYTGMASTCFALKLAPLTLVRPTELRHAEKSEFDLEEGLWTISAEKMKMSRDHLIPLSHQAVELVSEAFKWSGRSEYLFPATTSNKRPMSENTINGALRRLGYSQNEIVGHGFRAMGSTLLNEMGYDENWIEVQLAHKDKNKVRAAYNRAKYLPQRRQMLQEWADYLDRLRLGVYNSV